MVDTTSQFNGVVTSGKWSPSPLYQHRYKPRRQHEHPKHKSWRWEQNNEQWSWNHEQRQENRHRAANGYHEYRTKANQNSKVIYIFVLLGNYSLRGTPMVYFPASVQNFQMFWNLLKTFWIISHKVLHVYKWMILFRQAEVFPCHCTTSVSA